MRDKRPEVEPLSELEWQRVERGLFAALDCDAAVVEHTRSEPRRRGWAPWAFAAGFAAATAAVAIAIVVGTGDAPVAPSPPSTAQGSGMASAVAPSRVVTHDAATEVSFGDATITVEAASAVTMHGDAARGVLILLERGAATFEVAPRVDRPAFVVQAGDVSVRVIGTRFTVSRSGDAARVDVVEGHVEVVSRGHRAQVLAGASWSSLDDREAVVRDTPSSSGVAVAPFDPPATKKKAPKVDARALYEKAAALEATDPPAALAEYRAISRGKGPWAANALYAAGRLAAELGDEISAAAYLRAYLDRFPGGANAADAKALLDSL